MLLFPRRFRETVVSALKASSGAEFHVPAAPSSGGAPALERLDQLVQKRLDIARLGLAELRSRLECGQDEDAEIILNKIDEDLYMLRRRLRCEVEKALPRTVPVRRAEVQGGPRRPR